MSDTEAVNVARWRALLDEPAVPMDSMYAVQMGRHDVLIVRTAAGLRAFGNLCPHKMCPLVDGLLENGTITCKAHRWSFDAQSGRGINPRGSMLRVYDVRVVDGRIEVDLS